VFVTSLYLHHILLVYTLIKCFLFSFYDFSKKRAFVVHIDITAAEESGFCKNIILYFIYFSKN